MEDERSFDLMANDLPTDPFTTVTDKHGVVTKWLVKAAHIPFVVGLTPQMQ